MVGGCNCVETWGGRGRGSHRYGSDLIDGLRLGQDREGDLQEEHSREAEDVSFWLVC